MPRLRCTICEESLLIENFRFFSCGHGLCENCLRRTRSDPTCAFCRQPKGIPHQIFLNFSEPTADEKATTLADGLDRMDANSPAVSLERASRKLKDVVRHVDADTANNLLEAARNLEERILPLSTMLELQRADNAAYQKQIASLEGKLKQTESLDGKVSRLRVRLGEAEKNYETAASLAEKVAKRAAAKQDEIGRLKESLERYRHALKNKDEEVQRTKAALELKETQVRLLNTKLKALAKSGSRPRIRTEDPDASLLVEPQIKHAEGMVDLDLDLDGSPRHRLKTRTNLPISQSKKRKLVASVAVDD